MYVRAVGRIRREFFENKEWELEKETKLNSEFLFIKSSGIIFIFLPDYMAHNSSKIFF